MNAMTQRHRLLPLLLGCLTSLAAGADTRPVTVTDLGEPVERQLSGTRTTGCLGGAPRRQKTSGSMVSW